MDSTERLEAAADKQSLAERVYLAAVCAHFGAFGWYTIGHNGGLQPLLQPYTDSPSAYCAECSIVHTVPSVES